MNDDTAAEGRYHDVGVAVDLTDELPGIVASGNEGLDRLRDDGCRNRAVFAPDAFPLPVAAEFDLRTVGVDHLVLLARVFLLLDGICHREILEMRGEELLRRLRELVHARGLQKKQSAEGQKRPPKQRFREGGGDVGKAPAV